MSTSFEVPDLYRLSPQIYTMDCTFDGNSDMYGLGIRVGFYLQWFGAIFASFLAPNEVEGARFALATFNAATFLALVIQTAQNSLRPVEVYLIVLLTFGFYHSMIPLYAWRLLTWWDPSKDPSRYPIVPASPTYSDLHIPLLLAVVSFQMWFWIAKVPMLGSQPCGEYGFLFAKIRLNQPAFRIINIILYVILGTIILCIAVTRVTSRKSVTDYAEDEKRLEDRMGRDKLIKRISSLQRLDSATKFVTASIVVVATEMTIDWNGISDVNSLSSAGQTIPFLLGFALVVRLLYLY